MDGFKLIFIILSFFAGIYKFPVKGNKIIKACVSEPLEITCKFNISTKPTFVALWDKTAVHIQGLNMTTMEFECNKGHRFYQQCLLQMNNSTYTNDTVNFKFNKGWSELNQSSVWCFTRNRKGIDDNISDVPSKIDLINSCQDQKESTTMSSVPPDRNEPTTPTSAPVTTPAATASQPNASSPGVAETSSDKCSTGFMVVMCSVSFIVGAVLARAPDIYHCYIKCRRRDAVENDRVPNGNIPEEHPLNQEQTSEV